MCVLLPKTDKHKASSHRKKTRDVVRTWINWPGLLISTADWTELVVAKDSGTGFIMAVRGWWDWGTSSALCSAAEFSNKLSEETQRKITECEVNPSRYLCGTSQIIHLPRIPFSCAAAAPLFSPLASAPCAAKTRSTKQENLLLKNQDIHKLVESFKASK